MCLWRDVLLSWTVYKTGAQGRDFLQATGKCLCQGKDGVSRGSGRLWQLGYEVLLLTENESKEPLPRKCVREDKETASGTFYFLLKTYMANMVRTKYIHLVNGQLGSSPKR